MKNKNMTFFKKRKYHFRVKPIVLAMATMFPCTVLADIAVDTNDPQRLNVSSAANGTPLININDPNNSGVSHNKYADFNVNQQGVIFNNSMQDGVTQTGGYAIKNAQLSSEARVILNEVTGANGSRLAGSMEVFGRTADLIVTNERGITVNGVSTVNTSNLTLSTGKVNVDPNGNVQLAVERGNISVEGAGINTEGLSYFDIVSRSATLSGEIAGNADIKIVAGLNNYDTSSRTHSVRSRTGSDTPKIAISGTQLGSMYGNRIQLISTESGAGVTHQGSIVGSNTIEITADGDIGLAAVVSKNESVKLAGNSITLNKQAGVGGLSAHYDVILTALATLNINADVVSKTGSIRIQANSLLQSAANLLAQNGAKTNSAVPAIHINVADRYVISGTLYAIDNSGNQIAGAQVTFNKGKFVVKVGSTVLTNATVISDANIVSTAGNIAVTAGTLENNRGIMATRKGSLIFNLTDALVNNGSVEANGSIEFHGQRLKNSGIFTTNDRFKLTVGTLENEGGLYAGQLAVAADKIGNQGIIISEDGDISLQVKNELANSGTVQASGAIGVKASSLDNKGKINAAKDVALNLAGLKSSGVVQGENITANLGSMDNSGSMIATSGNITLTLNGDSDAVNSGTIQAGSAISLTGKTLRNQGNMNAQTGALGLFLNETLDNSGALYGNNINIVSNKLKNTGETISEDGHLSVEVRGRDGLINSGILQAQSGKIITVGVLTNQGSIATVKDLQIA
ncbi:filamentous hemagglutinin N-terminal domain-containing protein, partial [Erwinia sp.]|uniref:filamentous hemagglutinin N-terminal domain-containing protein n=1 Tax=Erwinia citreus TaxID=558 RepID=UPI00289D9C2B